MVTTPPRLPPKMTRRPPIEISVVTSDSDTSIDSSTTKQDRKRSSKKKSGVRTKFLLESLRVDYYTLQRENHRLREFIQAKLPDKADAIFAECCVPRQKIDSIDELAQQMSGNLTISEEAEDGDDEKLE
jgi:hypothetical protein